MKKVTPLLSYYAFSGSTLTLGAGVNGLVDTGGTCTVTASRGDSTVTQRFSASPGPTSTDCGAMALTSPRFVHGTWSLIIAYSSLRASGTSAAMQVTL
ncbi:hypothetical protein GCM10025867_37560 [Frondihabitans sucicola]|uniref:Peptidase A1 domain-containing protein n=1 Tax=Frondihabitans sucicola TaxID=1268041 RepID=A0ABM8GSW4_9MICO|nr:hypothetical protein GCM10025867_37560 [Frondihabitans sucicola]